MKKLFYTIFLYMFFISNSSAVDPLKGVKTINTEKRAKCINISSKAKTKWSSQIIYNGCYENKKKFYQCSLKTKNAETEYAAQIIFSGCYNNESKLYKCGNKIKHAKTKYAAQIIYSGCYSKNEKLYKCGNKIKKIPKLFKLNFQMYEINNQ